MFIFLVGLIQKKERNKCFILIIIILRLNFLSFFSLSPLGVFSSSMYAAATFGVFSV